MEQITKKFICFLTVSLFALPFPASASKKNPSRQTSEECEILFIPDPVLLTASDAYQILNEHFKQDPTEWNVHEVDEMLHEYTDLIFIAENHPESHTETQVEMLTQISVALKSWRDYLSGGTSWLH